MTSTKTIVFTCFMAVVAVVAAQNNPNYPALVDACLTDWKGCLGTTPRTGINPDRCDACIRSCGRQDISTPPDGTLCTQLRNHCRTLLVATPPGPTCQSPTCVNYYARCLVEGPSSAACGYFC